MSKIESNSGCTNLDKSSCAHKNPISPSDWGTKTTHDKNRGRFIAFARLISTSLRKVFTNSCARPDSRRSPATHQYKIANYILPGINLFGSYLRIVSLSLNLIASHVCALSIWHRFTRFEYKYCCITNITVFKQPNY